jgi:glycine oxidase
MLAASDPENPPELRDLSSLSLSLYRGFLDRIFDLSGISVPFQTSTTLQEVHLSHLERAKDLTLLAPETLSLLLPQLRTKDRRFILLNENSLDPRALGQALLAAVQSAKIDLRSQSQVRLEQSDSSNLEVRMGSEVLRPSRVIDCTGAWGLTELPPGHVRTIPRKGQMLAVNLAGTMPMHVVVRTPTIYIVPRTTGATAGRAVIGATVEDAGFDKTVSANDIARLRAEATELLPELGDAPEVETWAGLRPGTSDGLPLLGQVRENLFLATGHYRNGILLAPATAVVMAQILAGERPTVELDAFSPLRRA